MRFYKETFSVKDLELFGLDPFADSISEYDNGADPFDELFKPDRFFCFRAPAIESIECAVSVID